MKTYSDSSCQVARDLSTEFELSMDLRTKSAEKLRDASGETLTSSSMASSGSTLETDRSLRSELAAAKSLDASFFSAEARAILESTPELARTLPNIYAHEVREIPKVDVHQAYQRGQEVSLYSEFELLGDNNDEDEKPIYVSGVEQREFDLVLTENAELIDVRYAFKRYSLWRALWFAPFIL